MIELSKFENGIQSVWNKLSYDSNGSLSEWTRLFIDQKNK